MKQISIVLLTGFINFIISAKCYGEAYSAPLTKVIKIPEDGVSENRGPQGPPSIFLANGILFYQDGRAGPLQAFNIETFERLWTWPKPKRVPEFVTTGLVQLGYGDPNNFYEWEINCCAATENAIIVESCNYRTGQYFVSGIDITSGKELWRANKLSMSQGIIVDGLLIPTEGNLTGYQIQGGKIKWEIKYDYENRKVIKHIVDNKKAEGKNSHSLIWGVDDKIFSIDAHSGQILWVETPIKGLRKGLACADGDNGFGYRVAKPVDNIVCFCHQMRNTPTVLIAFDVKKHSLLWEYRDDSYDPYLDFVLNKGDAIIARLRGLVCLDAKTGKEKWECVLSYSTITGFTVSDNIIYCGDRELLERQKDYFWDGNIYAINRKTGVILWRYRTSDYFIGSPVLYEDKVYVLSIKEEENHNGIIRIFNHKITAETIQNSNNK